MNQIVDMLTPSTKGEKKKQTNQYTNGAHTSLTARKALALVMLEEGASTAEIETMTGLSKNTIYTLKNKGVEAAGVPERQLQHMRDSRLGRLELIESAMLDHLMGPEGQAKLERAGLKDIVSSLSVILEKTQLLSGKATSRVELIADSELFEHYNKLKTEVDSMIVAMTPGVDYEEAEMEEDDGEQESYQEVEERVESAVSRGTQDEDEDAGDNGGTDGRSRGDNKGTDGHRKNAV